MKIALANNLYYPFERGGAETVVEAMIKDFKAQGHEVFLLTTRPRGKEAPSEPGLKIYYFPSSFHNLGRRPIIGRLFWHLGDIFSFRSYRRAKKIFKQEKPDLVLTHNLTGLGFMLPLAIREQGIRHEHFLHDIQLLHPSGLMFYGQESRISSLAARLYQALVRAFISSPAKVISPSRWLLELHRRRGFFRDSETELRPFLAPPLPPAADGKADKAGAKKNFLFVGQIERHKGILFLIKTFKRLPAADIRLTIVGDGSQLEAARKLAEKDPRIEFLGRRPFEETRRIMAASDCLIVPSLCYENSPTVIFGAHQAGRKIIASDLGGIPEMMEARDSLFRPGDEEDLLNKLKTA